MARSVKVAGPAGITDARIQLFESSGMATTISLTEWPAAGTGIYVATLPMLGNAYYDVMFYSNASGPVALATYLHNWITGDADLALIITDITNDPLVVRTGTTYTYTNVRTGVGYDDVQIDPL